MNAGKKRYSFQYFFSEDIVGKGNSSPEMVSTRDDSRVGRLSKSIVQHSAATTNSIELKSNEGKWRYELKNQDTASNNFKNDRMQKRLITMTFSKGHIYEN